VEEEGWGGKVSKSQKRGCRLDLGWGGASRGILIVVELGGREGKTGKVLTFRQQVKNLVLVEKTPID